MGNACGNICTNSGKEQELNIDTSGKQMQEKIKITHCGGPEDTFLALLEEIEYPNTEVKVSFSFELLIGKIGRNGSI